VRREKARGMRREADKSRSQVKIGHRISKIVDRESRREAEGVRHEAWKAENRISEIEQRTTIYGFWGSIHNE
jgi:hypothetical protein